MENDLISRSWLVSQHCAVNCGCTRSECGFTQEEDGTDCCSYVKEIESAPSVEAEPVRNGWWVEWCPGSCVLIMTGEKMLWMCSACEAKYSDKENMKYCPNCGARMDAEEDDHG